ncbi:MAG: DUF2062 domain-containing protein [Pseudomonadota bacterium]
MAFKLNYRDFAERFKTLQGDPHYIAVGMAAGVFVSITPTIPFHTVIAIAMAFILRGSKPAAAIGAWLCNPVTLPLFYLASYKTGMFLLGKTVSSNIDFKHIEELMKLGMDVSIAMVVGGVILGIVPGIAAYFITRKAVEIVRSRKQE